MSSFVIIAGLPPPVLLGPCTFLRRNTKEGIGSPLLKLPMCVVPRPCICIMTEEWLLHLRNMYYKFQR